MKQIDNSNKFLFLVIGSLFAFALIIRIYYALEKDSLFLDENLSVILSNYTDLGWINVLPGTINNPYTGEQVIRMLFGDINTIDNIFLDIWSLRKDTRDIHHANLYYSLLRASFWKCDTSNLNHILIRGIGLNLLFFTIGFIFLVKILRRFTENIFIIGCVLTICFFNPISIANSIFIREYQLQETLYIILGYLFIRFFKYINSNDLIYNVDKKAEFLFILTTSLVSSLTILSGYFSSFLILLLWSISLYLIVKKNKNRKNVFLLCLGVSLVFIFIYLIYPNAIYILINRGDNVPVNFLAETLQSKLSGLYSNLIANYTGYIVFYIISALIIKSLFNRKREKSIQPLYLPIIQLSLIALLWIIAIWIIAPISTLRYIASAIPILSLGITVLLLNITNKHYLRNLISVAIIILTIGNLHSNNSIYWGKPDKSKINTEAELPLIIYNVSSPWKQTTAIPLFVNDRIIEVTYNKDSLCLKMEKYDKMYLLFDDNNPIEDIPLQKFDINYDFIFSTHFWLKAYYVEKK